MQEYQNIKLITEREAASYIGVTIDDILKFKRGESLDMKIYDKIINELKKYKNTQKREKLHD